MKITGELNLNPLLDARTGQSHRIVGKGGKGTVGIVGAGSSIQGVVGKGRGLILSVRELTQVARQIVLVALISV